MKTTLARPRTAALLATGAVIAGLALAPTAHAKGGGGEPGDDHVKGGGTSALVGDFSVTVNGKTYNPAAGKTIDLKNVAVQGPVAVNGVHVGFTMSPTTLGVYDYTLTGAPDPARMVTSPTVVFASKVPQLSAAQLSGVVLRDLQVRDDTLVATFGTAAGKLKVQAKDAPQGGIFQMEPEFAGPVTIAHTLGQGLFYFVNPFTGKVNLGNGVDAVTPAQSSAGYHQMLLGKDSPQVATKLTQTATTTTWSVASGGRMGGVLGEDAIELSQGATSCTSQCQAQNQVRGSLPVPPDPINPTPIG